MNNDVFISYSSMDKHTADAVCSTFENNGIRCWIAPRDIFPGSDWAQSIINAIKSCKIMVLIFSQNSNRSPQVTKELNLAVSNNLMVVPFKIDDSVPSGSMEYYLADMHWLDAINGDMQEQINRLKDIIISVLPHNMKDGNNSGAVPPEADMPKGDNACVQTEANVETIIHTFSAVPEDKSKTAIDKTESIGFLQAYKLLWQNCFNYKDCATRAEYWKAVLINAVVAFIILMINVFAMSDTPILISLYTLAASLAFISIGVRRLHDTNRSGHWMWLMLTGYGAIVPFVFLCFKSVDNGNRFKQI